MSNLRIPTTLKYRSIAATVAVVAGGTIASTGTAGATAAHHQTPPHANMSHSQHVSAQHSQAATDLRVGMNNLLREHVSVSLDVTRAIASDAPQQRIDGAMAAQYANSDDLSTAVGSVYGQEAQAKFSEMFREHIVESNKYAMAVANNDEAGKEAALAELQEYLNEIADFFAAAIPGLPAQDVYKLLNEHEDLINRSTEAYAAGDFVQSYLLEREALAQVSGAADALSGAIVATQPGKF